MGMAVVTLKKGEGRLLKSGGMWVFDNEIDTIMGSFTNGDMVLIHDFDGYPMGRGFINTNSKITVRLMTRDENVDINEDYQALLFATDCVADSLYTVRLINDEKVVLLRKTIV